MRKDLAVEIYNEAVLNASEKLFEAKGYESTSIDDIARCTGISRSTLYVYFDSKQTIWDSIVCRYMEQILGDAKKAAESDGSFEERYYKLCFDIADKFEKHPLFCKGTLGKISVDTDKELYKKIYDIGEQTNEEIAKFIRSGIEEGIVRKDIDIYPAVIMMWSSISGIISMANDKEEYIKLRFKMTKEEYLKNAFKMLLDGVL